MLPVKRYDIIIEINHLTYHLIIIIITVVKKKIASQEFLVDQIAKKIIRLWQVSLLHWRRSSNWIRNSKHNIDCQKMGDKNWIRIKLSFLFLTNLNGIWKTVGFVWGFCQRCVQKGRRTDAWKVFVCLAAKVNDNWSAFDCENLSWIDLRCIFDGKIIYFVLNS